MNPSILQSVEREICWQNCAKAVKKADKIYLATDPTERGEAISWHLSKALKLDDKNTSRITFNEITKNAVKKSIKEARDIDMNSLGCTAGKTRVRSNGGLSDQPGSLGKG